MRPLPTSTAPEPVVTIHPHGERLQVTCSSCGPLSSHTLDLAAREAQRWHQVRHENQCTLHLAFTAVEMERLRALAYERAQDPEDVVREILSHALAVRPPRPLGPRPPHVRMVS